MLLVKNMLCGKLHCQKGFDFILFSYYLWKLPAFRRLTNTDPFAAWFVVNGDATPGGIRVVRSVLGAIGRKPSRGLTNRYQVLWLLKNAGADPQS